MSSSRRSQIVTDQPVQGELLFRVLIHWFLCMCVVFAMVFGWSLLQAPNQSVTETVRQSLAICGPATLGTIFMLPLILYDVLRVSSRFVGPIQSVRTTLRQLAEGEPARRVYLRRDDFWQELAHYTNVVADKLETRQCELASADATSPTEHRTMTEDHPFDSKKRAAFNNYAEV